MTRWASSPLAREQIVLFSPTLNNSIEEDHPVRVLDEILQAFINEVEAQRDKKLSGEQADTLASKAQSIIDQLLAS